MCDENVFPPNCTVLQINRAQAAAASAYRHTLIIDEALVHLLQLLVWHEEKVPFTRLTQFDCTPGHWPKAAEQPPRPKSLPPDVQVAHVSAPGKSLTWHVRGLWFESLTLQVMPATPATSTTKKRVCKSSRTCIQKVCFESAYVRMCMWCFE